MDTFLKERNIRLIGWIGIALLLLIADFFSGPFIQFPVTFLIPIAFASWFNGRTAGIIFAMVMPLSRLYFNIALWTIPWTIVEASVNCLIRMVVFVAFAVIIDRTARQTRELSKEVQLLEGLLPICSFCKKIRDDRQEWLPIEKYIQDRSEASFSHGLCPDCMKEHYGHLFEKS